MSASTHPTPTLDSVVRYTGGARGMMIGGVVGILGLVLTFVGGLANPTAAMASYLVAFLYWLGIALGGLVLLMSHHAAGARWHTVLRRAMETFGAALPIFVLLFIPLVLGGKHVFPWMVHDHPGWSKEAIETLEHKAPYLNTTWFLIRAVIYFVVFIGLSQLLYGWSLRQDETADPEIVRRSRRWSSGGLPFLGMALTFAAFDWLMSSSPLFFSTIFGVYYFAGGFLGAICLLVVWSYQVRNEPGTHGPLMTGPHWHNLGKLMLAFTCFWAYIAFSQYLLIWIANLPEEIPWYVVRSQGAWKPVFMVLVFLHFLAPFFILLSRDLKYMTGKLAAVAIWQLVLCWVDLYWAIIPEFNQGPTFHWTMVTAFVGVGGLAIAFALFRARGRYAVPVGDPYLEDSLRYSQP